MTNHRNGFLVVENVELSLLRCLIDATSLVPRISFPGPFS